MKTIALHLTFTSLVFVLAAAGAEAQETEAATTAPSAATDTASSAAALTADEIVHRANLASYYAGDDGRATVKMTIRDGKGGERTREFVILRKDVTDGGAQKFYVHFRSPADVRDMVYMVWKHLDRDDDRWLYLPALDLNKRIAASDERTSFAGSHYYYEDVSGRGEHEDTHTLVGNIAHSWQIENVPVDPKSVEFASYRVWIAHDTFLPMRAVYTDRSGKEYRSVEVLEVQEIQGIPTVTKSLVKDLATGGETLMEFSNIEYNIGLEDDVFTERYLRRPPRKWLR